MHPKSKQPLEYLSQTELFARISEICMTGNVIVTSRELLEVSLKDIMLLFNVLRGSIFILGKNGKDLILKFAVGMKVKEEERMVKRMGEGVVGQVAVSKKPIFVNDIASDERFLNYKARSSYRTSSFICAPLLIKDQLIGVINITDKKHDGGFSENELHLLDFLASQIALNCRRIELYQKFRVAVKESQTLKDRLGETTKETSDLKKQIIVQEKLATVGKLAGGIAHEFNNPLDGIIRYTNLCLEHIKEEDDIVRGYLLEVKNGLNRMADIVRNLLACSRNINPVGERRINVNATIKQALSTVQTEIVHRNIRVIKHLSRGIPDVMDRGLERVVTNLLRNATDAIESNGEIEIISSVEDGNLILKIHDTGCGIDGDIGQVFEPFYTTKDIDKGYGLGLTIVGEIVKSYNGQVQVESDANKGTAFTVSIPIE